MTCIVGLIHNGNVYMGGDSAGVAGMSLAIRSDQKVFWNSNVLIGYTTSFRMGQILRYEFKPPSINTWDVWRYMATDFVSELRRTFDRCGWKRRSDDGEDKGGTFLVGTQGQLFIVHSDFQVGVPTDDFAACGCGEEIALGSLYTSAGRDPEARVRTALEAAERFSAGVRGPFTVECTR